MNKFIRHRIILDHLQKQQGITVADLCELLNVSSPTIRRDLDVLQSQNLILRRHGYASLAPPKESEPPIITRALLNCEKKQQIGIAAAELIQDGETIYLSGGTTTIEVAKNLKNKKNLTVITSAINIINILAKFYNICVIVPGGTLVHDHLTLVGFIAQQSLNYLRADKAIMGVSALDVNEGITSETIADAETDRAILDFAPVVIVVTDSSKFGLRRTARVAPVTKVQYIVTDDEAPEEDLEILRKKGVNVIVTPSQSSKTPINELLRNNCNSLK